jgi:photosystem II stability/assembly factor-like uncharacterized protein
MRLRCLFALAVLAVPSFSSAVDDPKDFAAMKWRLVGPYAGGRVCRTCGVPGDPLTYYAATASGGVWKSVDAGHIWKPIFEDEATSSVGSIAVAASDPNVIYVGTGEANIRGNVAPGAGIYKSTDGGKTWKHVWKQVGQIGTIAVNPRNPDVCFAAVLGHAFGPNAERGVYRTLNGGKSWEKVLYKNEETGASDVAIDPNNPRIIFAGLWQARRRPWELISGGPGSDLFVSRDGGETWVSLKAGFAPTVPQTPPAPGKGLPAGIWGKVGVAIAPSNSQRIYAIIEAEKGGLYRSDDGGMTWDLANDTRPLRQRAWYYSTLTVHPTNPDVVYAPQVQLLKSIDGGKTFSRVGGNSIHSDHHDLWIDPRNPNRIIEANDAGVCLSADGGKTWAIPPLPISQCYHVSADSRKPYRVMSCLQDLGSASGPSNSLKSGGIALGDWYAVGGGESGFAVADPSDPDVVYAGEYGGIMTRYDHRTGQARNITINQMNPSGIDPEKHKYRFQWTAPILISPHDPKTVYHAAQMLFRTRDGGRTWQQISGDLTRNDKQKQQWSGGPITGDNTGAEVYCTIFALAESPKQKGLLWAGSDDGLVHISRDDGKTWSNVTTNVPGLPDWGTVTCVEPSPFAAGEAYLVVDNHRMDDYRPYVWKTKDFGKTWTAITDGLDPHIHCYSVREDPKAKGYLYLGTERGVMYSPDSGKTWRSLQLNLPTVPVRDLIVKDDDLVLATHGRSIWSLEDLTPVRQTTNAIRSKSAHLFPPMPAVRWRTTWGGPTSDFMQQATAQNPAEGASIWFQLSPTFKGEAKIEILDAKGAVVAVAAGRYNPTGTPPEDEKDDDDNEDGPPKRKLDPKPGLNLFVWDLTHDGATVIPGAKVDSGVAGSRIPVAPGTYTVRLTSGTQKLTQPVTVTADPRWTRQVAPVITNAEETAAKDGRTDLKRLLESIDASNATAKKVGSELQSQEKLALRVRDDISSLSDVVQRLRAVKKQLDLRKELLKDSKDAKDLLKQSEVLAKKLDGIEDKLHNPKAKIVYDIFSYKGGAKLYSQFTFLLNNLIDSDGEPTQAQQELVNDLEKELADLKSQFEQTAKTDIAKLNAAAKKLGMPELYVPPPAKKDEANTKKP